MTHWGLGLAWGNGYSRWVFEGRGSRSCGKYQERAEGVDIGLGAGRSLGASCLSAKGSPEHIAINLIGCYQLFLDFCRMWHLLPRRVLIQLGYFGYHCDNPWHALLRVLQSPHPS